MTDQKAPKGKFRVIGVDTFEGPTADYLIGDFDTRSVARRVAITKAGTMNKTYVYDEEGNEITGGFGTY